MNRIPALYFVVSALVLLVNLFGYYPSFVSDNIEASTFYLVLLPLQLFVVFWFLVLVFRNAPLNENISVFMAVYFFLQIPTIMAYGLREVDQLYDFADMMTMIVIGFSMMTLFVLAVLDIWPGYVSLTVLALLILRFLNLSWLNNFHIYQVGSEVIVGTIIYAVLGLGVLFLEAYTLHRFYELEE